MKVTFKEYYKDGDDIVFIAEQLNHDLYRLGYDYEHRILLIQALYSFGETKDAKFEDCEYAHIYESEAEKIDCMED